MKILTDIHTHTNASAHAYSTLYENICGARDAGLELVACTDHGPKMDDAPHWWKFLNFGSIPRVVNGVKVLFGAEVNILNSEGELDLPENVLEKLDINIASIHEITYDCEEGGDHTQTWLNVLDNPYVDILGHSGSPKYLFDIDEVVLYAKKMNKCIEINNHSFLTRRQNVKRCVEIALACKKYETPIVVNSDAHFMTEIGKLSQAAEMLEEIEFPEELIMNLNAERLIKYLSEKKNKKFDFGE